MAVKVLKPGLSTTVQDLGRPGFFHLGIPVGGAMDRLALSSANLLVGNDEGAAGLEAVFIGPELEFLAPATIAVTGADMPVLVDGVEQPSWTALEIKAGQVLGFGYLRSGGRIYVAISGGIDVPMVLGSRSTYGIGALGGFKGRPLATDDKLPIGMARPVSTGRMVPEPLRRRPGLTAELRVVPGLYWERLEEEARLSFFEDNWKVASEADRMGYRFKGGRRLTFSGREQPFGAGADPSNIVDSCYPYGSIQVPGGTEPIVLHRDAVSGGGYAMIGTVISADMDLIAQLQPNAPTRFVAIDLAEALQARRDQAALFDRIRNALAP